MSSYFLIIIRNSKIIKSINGNELKKKQLSIIYRRIFNRFILLSTHREYNDIKEKDRTIEIREYFTCTDNKSLHCTPTIVASKSIP